jgi:hypothetical protein
MLGEDAKQKVFLKVAQHANYKEELMRRFSARQSNEFATTTTSTARK